VPTLTVWQRDENDGAARAGLQLDDGPMAGLKTRGWPAVSGLQWGYRFAWWSAGTPEDVPLKLQGLAQDLTGSRWTADY
jgi:hypothetical protein